MGLKEEIFENFERLKKDFPTLTEISATFSGSGDEGWIEEEFTFHGGQKELRIRDEYFENTDTWYAILETLIPGWEINEGSHGTIIITDTDICVSAEEPVYVNNKYYL